MTKFHAVMADELDEEFGVSVTAKSRAEARRILAEDYPESRCVQLESPYDTMQRMRRLYRWAAANYEEN